MAVSDSTLDTVRAWLKQSPVRTPERHDRVYKEECAFSFDTAFSHGGLYLNLKTWQSFGERYLAMDQEKTGNKFYLHEKARKVPLKTENGPNTGEKPDKLAIGGEGGFKVNSEKFEEERVQSLVILPEGIRIPLPAPELPDMILNTLAEIAIHDSASVQDDITAWEEEEERKESQYAASLPLLEVGLGKHGRTIPSNPELWECDETGVKENLWLNLSTGFIGSGRQNWDGSGGNGAAVRHYEATGKRYPLAVKLGTITPRGADVYSYAEGDMVTDSKLAEHLAHWGINMTAMAKTEKSMAELQIDLNMSYEFDKITESGSDLQPLHGPGYIGLENLGNSCYMNSVLQVLWTIPGIQQRYAAAAEAIFKSAPRDPFADFPTQMAKVGSALCNGETGEAEEEVGNGMVLDDGLKKQAIRPKAFKRLVGKGHPEFSSGRQQDASEYFQHLLDTMNRAERAASDRMGGLSVPTTNIFEFSIETRVQCSESHKVSYKRDAPTNILSLNIPMEAAANKEEVVEYQEREAKRAKLKESNADAYIQQDGELQGSKIISTTGKEEKVLARVPLTACLQHWQADEEMGNYYSAAINRKTKAVKHQRLANFPPFLVIQLNRFYMGDDWTAKKLEVLVDVPEKLNLEPLRGNGLQPGEESQPDAPAAAAAAPPAGPMPDPHIVEALMQMGFSENGSKRAAVATKNGGTEASMEWVLSHMEDPDFNDPLPSSASGREAAASYSASPDTLAMLTAMGFSERQATAALKACQGSLERAADWLFSHSADLDMSVEDVLQPNPPSAHADKQGGEAGLGSPKLQDGVGRYRLRGFISHMGANTSCGHYVCHILKEDRWVIFNDEKVAVSGNPPKELGYLYFFCREDVL